MGPLMINVTDRPIALCEGVELNRKIRCSLKKVLNILDNKYEIKKQLGKTQNNNFKNSAEKAFYTYFSPYQSTKILYGDAFIQALMDVVSLDSRNHGIANVFKNLDDFLNNDKGLSATSSIKVKGLTRLLLFTLWCEKVIILPYNFHLGGTAFIAYNDIILSLETEVAAFFRYYKTYTLDPEKSDATLPQSGAETIYKYGPRFVWATDYHRFEDVNIEEVCDLHQFIIGYKNNKFQGSGTPPSALMLRELLKNYPNRMRYSISDIEGFVMWSHKPTAKEYSFHDFILNRDAILLEIEAQKVSKARAYYYKKYTKDYIEDVGRYSQLGNSYELLPLSSKEDHESIVEYFSKMHGVQRNGLEWLKHGSPYTGREHIYLGSISSLWLEAWNSWMKYRKSIQGYDTEDGPNRAFNLFCDYLFLYLPWWQELFPNNKITLPLSPNQLKRSVFIHRTQLNEGNPIAIDKLPLTFLDIIRFRSPSPETRYSVILQLIQFLDWVEIGFDDDERIAGSAYRNPLKRIDLPRVKKKTKTTKIPFSKRVYPHLLRYCYAVEVFGEYLQEVAMERPKLFSGKNLRQQKFLSTGPLPGDVDIKGAVSKEYLEEWPDNFGFVPFITFRGINYPIYRIPDVYQWFQRKIDLHRYNIHPGGSMFCWLPHLTVLRMLIGALETGLRLQSIQWLDLRVWDVINKRNGIPNDYDFNMAYFKNGHFALPMLISTDKTKDSSWDVRTIFRIRSCFYREQYFLESINEAGMDIAVDYDGIKDSRFGKILPLFRSQNSPKPVSDNVYIKYWAHLLWGFEEYFDANVSADNEFVQFVYLKKTDEDPAPDYSETNVNDLLAINTPHACRATYVTNRLGIMEAADIARQLGHSNIVTTMHYAAPTQEILLERLAAVDCEIQSGFHQQNSNSSYIRTDDPKSALYKSFSASRTEAINAFKFAPSIATWNTEELSSNVDGIEMLKNSPISQIRFRETHICPVGEVCPTDILVLIGRPLRCGLCPLAMRCVDHLPAIAAKINQLNMNVRMNMLRAEQLAEKNEPDSSVEPLYEVAEMDVNELAGWQYSHDVLLKMLKSTNEVSEGEYHMQSPDIVRQHLQVVTADRTVSEFLLQRIVDANAFPSMADPQIQLVADRYCRYILAGNYQPRLDDDPVTVLAGYIKTQIEPLGLTIADLAEKIDLYELARENGRPILSSNQTFLIGDQKEVE